MSMFDDAIEILLADEGGYVDNPKDPGGKTNFGITEATARDFGYFDDMKDLPRTVAIKIYSDMGYWGEELNDLPFGVAFSIFEARVMHGVSRANKMVQSICGVKQDGIFGPKTKAALSSMHPAMFCLLFNCHRLDFIARVPRFNYFGAGWVARITKTLSRSVRSCFQ